MPAQYPSADELKRLIIQQKGEPWLQEAVKKWEAEYEGWNADPALKLYMIGMSGGCEVPQIRAESDSDREGQPLTLDKFTDQLAMREADLMERKQKTGLYAIEGIVTTEPKNGDTRNKVDGKTEFYLQDPTGRAKVVAYADQSREVVANARIAVGRYYRFPLVGVLAGKRRDEDTGVEKVWKHFTLPPFGRIEPVPSKTWRDVYIDPSKDAYDNGSPLALDGFVAHLDPEDKEVCSSCGRWLKKDAEKNKAAHGKCGDYEVHNERSHRGTILTGTNERFAFEVPAYLDPTFPVGTGRVVLFGNWNGTYKSLKVERWEVLGGAAKPKEKTPVQGSMSPKERAKMMERRDSDSVDPAVMDVATGLIRAVREVYGTPRSPPEATDSQPEVTDIAFDPSGPLGSLPDGVPRPADMRELAALDFRALQKLAKALNVPARQKDEVLRNQIASKLSQRPQDAPEKATPPPTPPASARTQQTPDAGFYGAPEKTQSDLIKEAVILGLETLGPMDDGDMVAAVREAVKGAETPKVRFVLGIMRQAGTIATNKEGKWHLSSAQPAPAPEPEPEEDAPPTSETDGLPDNIRSYFKENIGALGVDGQVRTPTFLGNAVMDTVEQGLFSVSEKEIEAAGGQEAALKARWMDLIEVGIKAGCLEWAGSWTTQELGGKKVTVPPKHLKWVAED